MLTTKEGWASFVTAAPTKPPKRPAAGDWRTMTSAEKAAFNELRLVHHSSFGPINTSSMRSIHAELHRQANSNLFHPPGARPGSLIDGSAGRGKTTILTHFGANYERELRRRFPSGMTASGDEFIPVVYVALAAGTTVKGLNEIIADFYALPHNSRATKVELTLQIQRLAHRCATSLVCIDDLHYLKLNNQADREVSDHLKHLASTIAATFVYAGIDCEQSGLLREGKPVGDRSFSQTSKRFALLPVRGFTCDDREHVVEWEALLKAIEMQLVLLQAPERMLSQGLNRYLFERTHGEIGSLMSLVRQGAVRAIETETECFTMELLDEITLDYAAERGRNGYGR